MRAGPLWASALGASVAACEVVPLEEAARAVVGAAAANGADVLVVEARPRALGPFAADLLASAACSVLVARRSYARGPVVVWVDASDAARAAVAASCEVASRLGVPLVAVHAAGEAGPALEAVAGSGAELKPARSAPGFALLAAERELGACLVVLGAASRSGAGAAALAVATAATGPVLLARDADG
jgi:hypothetical protein